MNLRDSERETRRAHPILRLFAGVVSIPFVAAGVWSAIAEFPLGSLAGVGLAVLGIAAGVYAWRGREPRGFSA